ncbi:Thioredoxin-like fold [Pseudocohnilembus persalinus]|uniref:protein-disulfide reductase n=1 Tax=Pseudocohnilembus persalinus TaxID=266149 RepID=A0A0V0QVI6_PSEPJ|nr:Thioredoxin-like fold [Pseudocohnilembus persalinus]|eukprot:KRX06093.1 Thioredoxin-like fold [Pseudocohnilembus persalinus]
MDEDNIPEREQKIYKVPLELGTKFQKFKKTDINLEQQQTQQLSQKEREKLENANKEILNINNLFENHKIILLYFGAYHSPPAQAFLPRLIKFYNEVNTEEEIMQIIYVPFDNSQQEYELSFKEMPWLCLPFNDPRNKQYAAEYQIKGVPNLIAINQNLECIHKMAKLDVIKTLKDNIDPEDQYNEWCGLAQKFEQQKLQNLQAQQLQEQLQQQKKQQQIAQEQM